MGKKFQVSHFSFQLFSILPWWDIKIKNKNKWPTVYFDKTKCPIHIMLWNKIKELRKIQGFSLRSLTELSLCRGLTCIKKKKIIMRASRICVVQQHPGSTSSVRVALLRNYSSNVLCAILVSQSLSELSIMTL